MLDVDPNESIYLVGMMVNYHEYSVLRVVLMSATADIGRYRDYFKDYGGDEWVEVLAIPNSGQKIVFQKRVSYLEEIGLCPEAANHLQEMKDMLIAISNELLDDVNELSPKQIEKLRQDRLQLNKQIQPLESYLCSNSLDEERRKSNFSASTTTPRHFQHETPQAAAISCEPNVKVKT